MPAWIRQKYVKVPASSNVTVAVDPKPASSWSKSPSGEDGVPVETPGTPCVPSSPDVTVCTMSSPFVHLTLAPTATDTSRGVKANEWIEMDPTDDADAGSPVARPHATTPTANDAAERIADVLRIGRLQ
jgi:hypothetical protein